MRFLQLLLCVCCLLPATTGWAQVPGYYWADGVWIERPGNFALDVNRSLATAPNGEVITSLAYESAVTVAGQTYPAVPASSGMPRYFSNGLLLRRSATGTVLNNLLLVVNGGISAATTDQAGNIYAVGRFNTRVEAGGQTLTATPGDFDTFVGKWNAAGTLQWLQHGRMTTPQWTWPNERLLVDDAQRLTICGTLDNPMTIGGTTLGVGAYALQLNSADGSVRWSRTSVVPMNGDVSWSDAAVNATSGDIWLVGNSWYDVEWGGQLVTGTATDSSFWLHLNASGALLSGFRTGVILHSITSDADGYSFLAGHLPYWNGTATQLHTATLTATPVANGYTVLARLDALGHPQWVKLLGVPNGSVGGYVRTAPHQVFGGEVNNVCYLTGYYYSPGAAVELGGASLPASDLSNNYSIFLAAFDGLTGAGRWAERITSDLGWQGSFILDARVADNGRIGIGFNSAADTVRFGPIMLIDPTPGPGQTAAITGQLVADYNQVQGAVYVDQNRNGRRDAGETGLPNLTVRCQPDGTVTTSAATGAYSAITELGIRSVELPAPPLYYTLPAPPTPATFATFGNIAAGRDFALQPIANQPDAQVFVTPVRVARAGFPLRYQVRYRNVGTTTLTGSVVVQLDPTLTYLGLVGATGTRTGNVLTVPYANLAPLGEGTFDIQFQTPTTVTVGTVLVTTATVEPVSTDRTPADNVEENRLTVVGSFDPNDIRVNWPRLTPTQVTAGEWLEYVIRFENMGNDTAFSVLLRDSLPGQQLNLGTLQMLTSSHSCQWHLNGAGVLSVQFPNIRLPYRNINALGSMGFIRFRVRARGTLAIGDVVPNRAAIHFDYNAPVITNTALTRVQMPNGVADALAETAAVRLWPNPATGALFVETNDGGPLTLTLFDAVGRPVRAFTQPDGRRAQPLDVRGLTAGLYVLRGTGWARRVVVQ